MTISVSPPFPIFTDVDGAPVDAGSIYISQALTNPFIQANQLAVYSDAALTIPIAQPIVTNGGYAVVNGSPTQLYVNATDYAISITDKNGVLCFTSLSNKTKLGLIDLSTDVTGLLPSTSIKYQQTKAEQAAGAVPVNYSFPSHDQCGLIWIDRYQDNTTPGTTDMLVGWSTARNVAETVVALGKLSGGKIAALGTTYSFSGVLRHGWFVRSVGVGPGPTKFSWDNTVTDKCILLETAGGSYAFGAGADDIDFSVGTNARWGVFSQGAHQDSAFRRCSFENVNQIGMEFGSLGGPSRMIWDDIWINAGSTNPISTSLNNNFVTGNTVITVASTTGFVVGLGTPASPFQWITVVLDSGSLHHTYVAAINPGVSITLGNALPSNASTGKTLRTSRKGIIVNNGSNNWMPQVDVEGAFDICVDVIFGNAMIGCFHTEAGSDVGIHCAQSQVDNGQLVEVFFANGSVNNNVLVDIATNFIGSVKVHWAGPGQSPARIAVRNNQDPSQSTVAGATAKDWEYTTPVIANLHPSYTRKSWVFSTATASDWSNRAQNFDCGFPVAGRIYAPIVYRDVNNGTSVLDAVGLGVDYDTGTNTYEFIVGVALAVAASPIVEKLRVGKNAVITTVPILTPVYTVATLPALSAGHRAFVSDATATVFNNVVVGGGANYVPVFRDNAGNWRIG